MKRNSWLVVNAKEHYQQKLTDFLDNRNVFIDWGKLEKAYKYFRKTLLAL